MTSGDDAAAALSPNIIVSVTCSATACHQDYANKDAAK